MSQHFRHILTGVEQVLRQVTAEHSFFEDARFSQVAPGRPRQYEAPEETDELAVFP